MFSATVGSLFPAVAVTNATVVLQLGAALLVGLVAASFRLAGSEDRIVDGLRAIG
jgi:uncharacterized membrane protein YdcZ (DUF606 family)